MPTPRALAQQIADTCLAMRARRVSRTLTRIYDDELRPHGIGVAQLNLLVALGVAGRLRPGQLCDTLDLEKSTLSRNLRRLEEQGWVLIERDGTAQVLYLSPEGERVLRAARPAWARAQTRARAALKSELHDVLGDLSG